MWNESVLWVNHNQEGAGRGPGSSPAHSENPPAHGEQEAQPGCETFTSSQIIPAITNIYLGRTVVFPHCYISTNQTFWKIIRCDQYHRPCYQVWKGCVHMKANTRLLSCLCRNVDPDFLQRCRHITGTCLCPLVFITLTWIVSNSLSFDYRKYVMLSFWQFCRTLAALYRFKCIPPVLSMTIWVFIFYG